MSREFPSRRVILAGGLALAGAGCSTGTPAPSATTAGPVPSAPPTPSPTASPTASPSPSPSVSSPTSSAPTAHPLPGPEWALTALPSRADVVARYAARPPGAWGLSVPGVLTHLDKAAGVALTFDACGGSGGGDGYDADLIGELRRLQVPATLFLNRRWITANPSLALELANDPLFEVESHGMRHVPLSTSGKAAYGITGTANLGEAYDELVGADDWFTSTLGRRPWFFRPGTAYADEACAALARELGRPLAGFAVNADAGATAPPAAVASALRGAKAGDIVIGHMNRPGRGTAAGVKQVLAALVDKGTRFVRLAEGFAAN